jgi:PleD family two-component response regulator
VNHHPRQRAAVLIVDDHPTNLNVLIDALETADFRTLIATNGEKALQQVGRFLPDLILLDVIMPGLDGFETCRRLKAAAATREIPVIFMTALDDVESKVKGFEAGAVDFVTKPIEHREVLARVTTHLTLRFLQKELHKKNQQLELKNGQLQEALDKIKTLRGLLPICANCKKIRDDQGYWQDVTVYIRDRSEADFSHGICPDCLKKLYPDLYEEE